jgi:hypothetical protein
MILFWFLPATAVAHIIEEFAFPGGFAGWYRNYRQSVASSVTGRYLDAINIVFVVLCILPLILDVQNGIALWLSMGSVIFFNAVFHIRGAVRTGKYSPGVVTSVVLYIPIAAYGYWYFLSSEKTSIEQALASFAVGVFYWLFSSFNHRRRARKASAQTYQAT